MSSFSENFERAEHSDVQFDDLAFYPVIASFIIFCSIGLVIVFIKGLLSKFKYSNENEFTNCQCNACQKKLQNLNQQAKVPKSRLLIYFLLLISLFISFYFCYQKIILTQGKVKSFDPYEILEVSMGDDEKTIKKAYKRLALKYHPDKNLNNLQAKAQFILITKAYNALTDEESKKNYELYGNPDGRSSMRVSVGLPSFILDKKNHMKILLLFLIIIIIVIPYYFFRWYNNSHLYDSNGYLLSTNESFFNATNENSKIYHIPFYLGLADEFNQFAIPQEEIDLINKTYMKFSQSVPEYKEEISLSQKKAITISYCYAYQLQVTFSHYDEYVILIAKLIDQFFLVQLEKYHLFLYKQNTSHHHNIIPEYIKPITIDFINHILTYQQSLFQGVNIKALSNPLHAYMQLPHMTLDHITKKEGIVPFAELIKMPKEKQEEVLKNLFNFKPEEIEDICNAVKSIPVYEYKIKYFVDGFEDFVYGDLVTYQLMIKRHHIGQKKMGLGHSLRYPGIFNECIQISVTNQGRIIHQEKIKVNKKVSKYEFVLKMGNVGNLPINFDIVPTCYMGLNVELKTEVKVEQHSQKRKDALKSIEARKVKIEPSFFQNLLNEAGLIQGNDSDEEEEDETVDKTKQEDQMPKENQEEKKDNEEPLEKKEEINEKPKNKSKEKIEKDSSKKTKSVKKK